MADLRNFLPFTSELQQGEVRIQNGLEKLANNPSFLAPSR